MEEPSVLDYVKSLFPFWKGEKIVIPPPESPAVEQEETPRTESALKESPAPGVLPEPESSPRQEPAAWARGFLKQVHQPFPWRALLGLGLALLAQRSLEPPSQNAWSGVAFYTAAALFLLWGFFKGELNPGELPVEEGSSFSLKVRTAPFLFGLGFALLAFFTLRENTFTAFNLLAWLAAVVCIFWAFWIPSPTDWRGSWISAIREFLQNPVLNLRITGWALLVLLVTALVVWFRFYHLAQTPAEMISDQAEKLLDVNDVINGQYSIFFPRNTGREAFQFYWTAAIISVLGTGVTFLSLKIGTVLAGLLTLPYVYLLGRDMKNRWVGLFALLLAGISYWANVISRFGLRFPFYALFAAPALYYLMRGLRRGSRNDLLLSGLALGIGLHGYSPIRIVPFALVIGVMVYILHSQSCGRRQGAFWALLMLALVSFMVFLPLFRFAIEYPESFVFRAFSRLSGSEQALPGPAWKIFLENFWKAWTMFFWNNGDIWPHSVPNRPALDIVSAALYFIGSLLVLVRYLRRRHWADLFLLLSVPLMLMPSILSLAFPGENPCLNRTSAAIVPVFVIAAIGLEALLSGLMRRTHSLMGAGVVILLSLALLGSAASHNYDLVFNQYNSSFRAAAWNTSDIGQVVGSFARSIGSPETAYVVGWPHWVDTRLVGINAGYPTRDYAIWPKDFESTQQDPRAKLFILNTEDSTSITLLNSLYPKGSLQLFDSPLEGKDFYMFFVPPAS